MREITRVTNLIFTVTSEPGDATRYSYLIYRDGPDIFNICARKNSFNYPRSLNFWDIKDMVTGVLYETFSEEFLKMAESFDCNPHSLRECILAILEICETYGIEGW